MPKTKFITYEKAKEIVKEFAKAQGFYGRKLQEMEEWDTERQKQFNAEMQENKCRDSLDLVFYFEC